MSLPKERPFKLGAFLLELVNTYGLSKVDSAIPLYFSSLIEKYGVKL